MIIIGGKGKRGSRCVYAHTEAAPLLKLFYRFFEKGEGFFMPLIECIDCGNKISDRAEACPHCGCPVSVSIAASAKINTEDQTPVPQSHDVQLKMDQAKALSKQADTFYNTKEYAKALDLYREAANQGYAHAQYMMGVFYQNGFGGLNIDYTKALQWYNKSIKQGNPNAWNNIGSMYSNGIGVPQDKAKALQCYLKASDLNSVTAPFNIGVMYANGIGTSKDPTKAAHYYQLALERGYENKILYNNLGVCYMDGVGVNRDYYKAGDLFKKAIDHGSEQAKSNLELLNQHIAEDGMLGQPKSENVSYSSSSKALNINEKRTSKDVSVGTIIGWSVIIIGIILFAVGSITGTITGYQGADGLYYSDLDAVGSNEWMCLPAAIIVVFGIIIKKLSNRSR